MDMTRFVLVLMTQVAKGIFVLLFYCTYVGDPGGAHLLPSETVSICPAALRSGSGCGMDYVRTASEDVLRGE